jgi:hypothetical protein
VFRFDIARHRKVYYRVPNPRPAEHTKPHTGPKGKTTGFPVRTNKTARRRRCRQSTGLDGSDSIVSIDAGRKRDKNGEETQREPKEGIKNERRMHTEVVENITGEDVVSRDAVLVILPGARDKVFSSRVGYVDLAARVVEPEGERREERDGVALVGHVGEAELQEGKSVTFRLLLEEKSE